MKTGKDVLIVGGSVVVLVVLFFAVFLRPKSGPQFEIITKPALEVLQEDDTKVKPNYIIDYGDITNEEKDVVDLAVGSLNPTEAVLVNRVVAQYFSDSSLDCPQEDTAYSQVITQGYVVLLQVGDFSYDYRVKTDEPLVLQCSATLTSELFTPQ